jgi:predicted transcriptional regulator
MAQTHYQSEEEQLQLRKQMARSLAQGGMDDVHVVSQETAQTVLTPRRREIIQYLKGEDPESVRALARELGRDKSAVSRDLATLAEHSIITYETNGRGKRPVLVSDHVVVEPIV